MNKDGLDKRQCEISVIELINYFNSGHVSRPSFWPGTQVVSRLKPSVSLLQQL
jgi:hypothetical protein